MPVILNASDCDFWLDVTALGACCEDRASLDPGASFHSPSNWTMPLSRGIRRPRMTEPGTVRSFWSQVVARAGRALT
jgi:hypothetical protein